jgi:hypothetical protein
MSRGTRVTVGGVWTFFGGRVNKGPDTITFQRRIFLVYFEGLKKYEEEMTEGLGLSRIPRDQRKGGQIYPRRSG